MQSFLIVSQKPDFWQKYINDKAEQLSIPLYNIFRIRQEKSLGIDAIRNLKKILVHKLAPEENQLIILDDFDKGTAEAQNALLKLLEEPPPRTYFLLLAKTQNTIIDTIKSRCQTIMDNLGEIDIDEENSAELFYNIIQASAGERLKISQNLFSNKEDPLKILNSILVFLQKKLLKHTSLEKLNYRDISKTILKILEAKKYLEKNIHPKTTLDILFLGFPRITM